MRRRVVAAGAALAAVVAAGCGTVGLPESGDMTAGKQLFQQKCGSCHVLADAGSQGRLGPDLDAAFATLRDRDRPGQGYNESTIRAVVRDQIAYPVVDTPTGAPGMPANLVTGEDADAVAAYVAAVAGLPVRDGGQQASGSTNSADPKTIFEAAGCGGCHVFGKAASTGTVGPNLDQSQMSVEEAAAQIANGGGGMPPFKDQLSEQQIQALAEWIAGG